MELNKEIEVFTEEKTEDLPKQEQKPVESPSQPTHDNKITTATTPPKPLEKTILTSNEVAVVNSNTDQALVWSKEKTGPERVRKHIFFVKQKKKNFKKIYFRSLISFVQLKLSPLTQPRKILTLPNPRQNIRKIYKKPQQLSCRSTHWTHNHRLVNFPFFIINNFNLASQSLFCVFFYIFLINFI